MPGIAIALCAAAAVLWVVATQPCWGRDADYDALRAVRDIHADWVQPIADLGNPLPFALILVAIALLGLLLRRPRQALLAAVVPPLAVASSQLLKPLLAVPRSAASVEDASWPSGHTTAAAALGIALVVVVQGRARPVAVLVGAALALGVGASMVVLGFHYPSDVLGGLLLAGAWWAAACALSRRA